VTVSEVLPIVEARLSTLLAAPPPLPPPLPASI
jgi:hypothetical protein